MPQASSESPSSTIGSATEPTGQAQLLALAKNQQTTPIMLTTLSGEEDVEVRAAVARNPNTPVDTLKYLSRDSQWPVREGVLRNRNTPLMVHANFSREDRVRFSVSMEANRGRFKAKSDETFELDFED